MKEKTVEVSIIGEKIILKTTDEISYVEKIAKELNDRINDCTVRGVNKTRATLLVALDLLDENTRLKTLIKDLNKNNG